MERIPEIINCSGSRDELLEEDCHAGGRWEQHIKGEYLRNTAGVEPAEVIRPGHGLQIEIAQYHRGQLHEDFPATFNSSDDYDSSDNEGKLRGHSVLSDRTAREDNNGSSNKSGSSGNSGADRDYNDGLAFDLVDYPARSGRNANNTFGGQSQTDQSTASYVVTETRTIAYQPNVEGFENTSPSNSFSEPGTVVDDLDANEERFPAVFAEFPACISKTSQVFNVDGEQYGLSALTKDDVWLHIRNESLTTEVREWIADFTSEYES